MQLDLLIKMNKIIIARVVIIFISRVVYFKLRLRVQTTASVFCRANSCRSQRAGGFYSNRQTAGKHVTLTMSQRFFEGTKHATLYAKFRINPPQKLVDRIVSYVKEKVGLPTCIFIRY